MKWLSSSVIMVASLLFFAAPASADIILDCETQSEGSSCTTPGGDSGTCEDVGGQLECVADEGGDTGTADAGEDAGPDEDAGAEADADQGSSSGDSSDDGCSSSPMSGAPMKTLAPVMLGLGLLLLVRRRE
jgi:MYXO-CTERM domain-containing protein